MRKVYVTSLLFQTAVDLAKAARGAHDRGLIEAEIRLSMSAHLMAASCLEGAINEVGEERLGGWFWERAEKLDPAAKWFMVSQLAGNGHFGQDREPIQTVRDLLKTRNIVAHPKGRQEDSDMIVRHNDGGIERNAHDEMVLADGDAIYEGYGRLLDEFSADAAERIVSRTLTALRQLRENIFPDGFTWIERPADYEW